MNRFLLASAVAVTLLVPASASAEQADGSAADGGTDAGEVPAVAPPEEDDGGCSCWWDFERADRGVGALPFALALLLRRRKPNTERTECRR